MEYFTNMTKNQATLALCSWGKYDFEELNGQEIEDFEWSDLTQPRQEDEQTALAEHWVGCQNVHTIHHGGGEGMGECSV